jgi:succinoglycan biosynthesis transport protein ExoP
MTSPAVEPIKLPAPRGSGAKAEASDYLDAKPTGGGSGDDGDVDLTKLFFAFRRRLRLFVAIAALVCAGYVLGPLRATPVYTATARVEIDPRKKDVVDIQQVESDLPINEVNIVVDTEVEVLKSRHLAERVVNELHLDQDPEFNPALRKPGLIATILHDVGRTLAKPEREDGALAKAQEAHERVVDSVLDHLRVRRSGLTYVIDVAFTSANREKAALIANTFGDRYLTEQMESKIEANRDANSFLNEHAAQMEQDVKKAEDELAQYKIGHNLLSAGNETLTQQEISNLDTQMAQAKAAQAEAEAQVRTARAQLAAGSNGSDVSGALVSPVVTSLRAQRATISTHVAELSEKYGPLHPDLLKAKQQLAEIDSEIQQEVNRAISGLEAQARIAKERTVSLEATLDKTRGALASNNRTSVELNDLQRNADAERALYEAFLTRAKQTGADRGLEVSDARVLSRANTPTHPSAPNVPILLLLALASAAGLAIAGVFAAENLDSGLVTGDDVETRLDIAFLGAIPHLASVIELEPAETRRNRPIALLRGFLAFVRPSLDLPVDPAAHVIEKSTSAFGEAFRGLRTSIRYAGLSDGGQIIAFASALPGEGKTTATICLGRIAARAGERVLMVDCDLRRNNVSKALGFKPVKGLLEVLNGQARLDEALARDSVSGAYILPLVSATVSPQLVFGTPAIDKLFDELRRRFDLVILNTPPVLAVSDARDVVAKADGVIFLARWRRTPQKAIESALQMIARVDGRLIGLALTQVDMREQSRYGYGDSGYYYRRCRAYYAS